MNIVYIVDGIRASSGCLGAPLLLTATHGLRERGRRDARCATCVRAGRPTATARQRV